MTLTPIDNSPHHIAPPTKLVTTVGVLAAVWCAIFAAISVWFEVTDKFATGPHAAEAEAISVMNWYVAVLKLLGVAVAVLAVTQPPKFLQPKAVGTLLWAAFSTVVIYVAGSLTQAAVMLTGVAGDAERLDLASGGMCSPFSSRPRDSESSRSHTPGAPAWESAKSCWAYAGDRLCWAASSSSSPRCSERPGCFPAERCATVHCANSA